MSSSESPAKRRIISRARHACQRCKTQKLRCDNIRPCSACSRLKIDCKEASAKANAHLYKSNHLERTSTPNTPGFLPPDGTHQLDNREPRSFEPPAPSTGPDTGSCSHDASPMYSQRPSTFETVNEVFRQRAEASSLSHAADAIPGGQRSAAVQQRQIPLSDVLGIELPEPHIVNFLVDTYMNSVHWFMSVIHGPSLRRTAATMMANGSIVESRQLFPILIVVIMAMAARYVDPEQARDVCAAYDLKKMESIWIRLAEEKLLDVFEFGGTEAVQISIILKSYYLYGNRPKRSIAILGAGIKVALSMKLHLEHTWAVTDPIRVNVRRRLWWSLWVADVWAATIYGTPCSIHDDDWSVSLPDNIDDDTATCPGQQSLEVIDGKTHGTVTVFSYQRYKFRLYQIAFRIINDVYTRQKTSLDETVNMIRQLDDRLKAWEAQIPPELLLGVYANKRAPANEATRLFRQQALVLQLSYDNFRLLLHRPLLTMNRLPARTIGNGQNGTQLSNTAIDEMIKTNKYTTWDAAMRTTQIGRFTKTMGGMKHTLGASYIMIQGFTAAVALGIFALSDPASRQAYEAKGAISKVLAFPKDYGYESVIFDQYSTILEELLRLILGEEMKALISRSSGQMQPPVISRPHPTVPETANTASERIPMMANGSVPSTGATFAHDTPQESPNSAVTGDMTYGNFSDALVSLQDAFREARTTADAPFYAMDGNYYASELDGQPDGWNGDMGNAFGNESQGWIWDELWQVPDLPFTQFD